MRYVPAVLSVLPLGLALAAAGLPDLHHPSPSRPLAIGVEGAALLPLGTSAAGDPGSVQAVDGTRLKEGAAVRLSIHHAPSGSRFLSLGGELGGAWHDAKVPGARGGAVRAWRAGLVGALAIPGRGSAPLALELSCAAGLFVPAAAPEAPALPFLRPTLYGAPAARLLVRLDDALELAVGAELLVAPGAVDHPDRQKELWLTAGPVAGLRLWI